MGGRFFGVAFTWKYVTLWCWKIFLDISVNVKLFFIASRKIIIAKTFTNSWSRKSKGDDLNMKLEFDSPAKWSILSIKKISRLKHVVHGKRWASRITLKITSFQHHIKWDICERCKGNYSRETDLFLNQRAAVDRVVFNHAYSDLIFNARGIEEWLDFLPQLPPWPGAELKVSTQWALDNGKGKTLFLQLLEDLTVEVTASPCLHPWHDAAETFVTEFLHLTQDTGTEEDLFRCEVKKLDNGSLHASHLLATK